MWSKIMRFTQNTFSTQPRGRPATERALARILFVCMGNVCRSPMAEGVLTRMLEDAGLSDRFHVASAGTHAYHLGGSPDGRSQIVAGRRGIDLRRLRVHRIAAEDFESYDYLLAMDRDNQTCLLERCPAEEHRHKIQLLLDYAGHLPEREVPDPYYGSLVGFERVMDLLEAGSEGLLLHLRERYRI